VLLMLRLGDYEVFECVTCKPPLFYAIKFLVASEGVLKKDVFHVYN